MISNDPLTIIWNDLSAGILWADELFFSIFFTWTENWQLGPTNAFKDCKHFLKNAAICHASCLKYRSKESLEF